MVQSPDMGNSQAYFEQTDARRREMNNWNIPGWPEREVKDRDRSCVYCCSKGTKKLSDWLESDSCKKRRITKETAAEVVRMALVIEAKFLAAVPDTAVFGE